MQLWQASSKTGKSASYILVKVRMRRNHKEHGSAASAIAELAQRQVSGWGFDNMLVICGLRQALQEPRRVSDKAL